MKDFTETPENGGNGAMQEKDLKTEMIPELPPVDKGEIFRTALPVIITEAVLTAVMLIVYAAIGKWSVKVLLGALLGFAAVVVNFTVMILTLLKAEKAGTPAKGELVVKGTYGVRMAVMLVVLVLALSTGIFDVVAVLLPLCFMRISLFASQLLLKKREKGDVS